MSDMQTPPDGPPGGGETPNQPPPPAAPEPAPPAPSEHGPVFDHASPPSGDDGRRRRPRRPKPSRRPGEGPPPRAAAEPTSRKSPLDLLTDGLAALSEAYLDLRTRTGSGRLEEARDAEAVELKLHVPLRRGAAPEAAGRLLHEIRDNLEKRVLAAGMLVPGRAWCFSSESFDSPYSRPEDPRQVLVGYGLEGRPRYADLVTLAIERKHDAVDDLLAGKEGAVSFVEPGTAITEGVRPAFDPDAVPYRLVAQSICGLFASSEEGRRVALTIQILAHDGEDGSLRLLAHPVSAVDLMDLPDSGIRRIIRNFQSKLVQVAKHVDGRKAAGEPVDLTEEVIGPLRELTRHLSQDAKNRDRKTNHARERESEGGRPTQLAFPEARSARDHHLYIDNEERTIVVIGKKGRVHVFSPDGRHVTTVIMPPPNVRQRVKIGRWRQAEPAERGAFREAIAGRRDDEAVGEGVPE